MVKFLKRVVGAEKKLARAFSAIKSAVTLPTQIHVASATPTRANGSVKNTPVPLHLSGGIGSRTDTQCTPFKSVSIVKKHHPSPGWPVERQRKRAFLKHKRATTAVHILCCIVAAIKMASGNAKR